MIKAALIVLWLAFAALSWAETKRLAPVSVKIHPTGFTVKTPLTLEAFIVVNTAVRGELEILLYHNGEPISGGRRSVDRTTVIEYAQFPGIWETGRYFVQVTLERPKQKPFVHRSEHLRIRVPDIDDTALVDDPGQ